MLIESESKEEPARQIERKNYYSGLLYWLILLLFCFLFISSLEINFKNYIIKVKERERDKNNLKLRKNSHQITFSIFS